MASARQVREIREADLGKAAHKVMEAVRRGQIVVIDRDEDGQPEAAIVDLIDYRLMRATVHYYAGPPTIDAEAGLPDEAVKGLTDPQQRFDLVWAHYIARAISLGRAGELLGLAWVDLRDRCNRLGLPLRIGPRNLEEAGEEVRVARALAKQTIR
jgi:hypothetical protein